MTNFISTLHKESTQGKRWSGMWEELWSEKENSFALLPMEPKSLGKNWTLPKNSWLKSPGSFALFRKKTSEANAGAEAGFFRTQSIKTFTFLNIKFYGKGLLVTYPDICSVWTSQTINTIKFWIQLEYSKRCKHTSKDFMQQCQETL